MVDTLIFLFVTGVLGFNVFASVLTSKPRTALAVLIVNGLMIAGVAYLWRS